MERRDRTLANQFKTEYPKLFAVLAEIEAMLRRRGYPMDGVGIWVDALDQKQGAWAIRHGAVTFSVGWWIDPSTPLSTARVDVALTYQHAPALQSRVVIGAVCVVAPHQGNVDLHWVARDVVLLGEEYDALWMMGVSVAARDDLLASTEAAIMFIARMLVYLQAHMPITTRKVVGIN